MALIEEGPVGPGPDGEAGRRLAALGGEYFRTHFAARPFAATAFGVAGYDAEVPDPGRAADERLRGRLAGLAQALDGVAPRLLSGLSMGLVAATPPADIELRRLILHSKLARFAPLAVPEDVIEFPNGLIGLGGKRFTIVAAGNGAVVEGLAPTRTSPTTPAALVPVGGLPRERALGEGTANRQRTRRSGRGRP